MRHVYKYSLVYYLVDFFTNNFSQNPQACTSYSRVINVARFKVLAGLLKACKNRIVIGGQTDINDMCVQLLFYIT